MTTIRDVAREAGVSVATVSRVVNKTRHPVTERTRARVLEAVRLLDFHPSAVAKSLSTRKAQTIGVVIPDISNPYYGEIVRGIQDTADEAGYTVLLQNTDRLPRKVAASVATFREKLADGIIFVGGELYPEEVSAAMGRNGTAGVVVGRQNLDLPAVRIDNAAAAEDTVRHLVSLGHIRIGFLAGPKISNTMQDRVEGYRRGLEVQGLSFDPNLVSHGALTFDDGYRRAGKLLMSGRDRPTAIVGGNDQAAVGAIRAADEQGMRISRDLAVAGFDNTSLATYFRPTLTTIDIPRHRIGATAVGLILKTVNGQSVSPITWLPTQLIVRESTTA